FGRDRARWGPKWSHWAGPAPAAVPAILARGARPFLGAVKGVPQDAARRTGRMTHVIAESDLNDPRLIVPGERGGYGLDGQWADDFHHAVHAYLTGEQQGYYEDFGRPRQIAEALESPYLYAGNYSPYRDRKHGASPEGLSG